MLDEVLEFKEYLWNPNRVVRLEGSNTFTDKDDKGNYKHIGIERALTVVARYYLTQNGYFVRNLGKHETNDTEYIKKKMATIEEVIHKLSAWMNSDIINGLAREKDKKYAGFSDSLVNKRDSYSNKACNMNRTYDAKDNTYKKITFEKIVAEAANIGPLQRYYLVCKKSVLEDGVFLKGKSIQDSTPVKNSGKGITYIDRILHLVAYYLLRQKHTGETQKDSYIEANITDLSNWIGFDLNHGDGFKYSEFYFNDEKGAHAIYSKDSKIRNAVRIKVPSLFIDYFDFKLIEMSEFDAETLGEDYVYFSDFGTNSLFQENKKYFS